ncbi:hypothetical protein DQ04_17361000 [Trypanosoma grayi]|uniref:hypothetical protein n=1 Tax=Trypanosoma grayi TaxID=71804 RepID=UPI0004F431E5|nr:hypothetical protein DQ04_17361000 [Trypanosoma grayi]KEG05914.1 hypothetical protein DQ04_17361000 [Trypanosoma grayi]
MFFPAGSLAPAYNINGTPFVALNFPYQQTAPLQQQQHAMGYAYASQELKPAALPPFHVCSSSPPPFSQTSSASSFSGGLSAMRITSVTNTNNNNTVNNSSTYGASASRSSSSNVKDQMRRLSSSMTSVEHSPGPLQNHGWGLSMTSPRSSATSSMGSPPIYVMLQPNPQANQQIPLACGGVTGMLPRASAAPPHQSMHDNGTMYKLGEWYEGVVKRYNPMRGFGFLTATHHLRVVSPQTATATSTSSQPETTGTGEEAQKTPQAQVVRTPVSLGDVFVHQSYIQMDGFRSLSIGDRVVFRIGILPGKKAHQAVSVQRLNDVGTGGAEAPAGSNDTQAAAKDEPIKPEPELQQQQEQEQKQQQLLQLLHQLAVNDGNDDICNAAPARGAAHPAAVWSTDRAPEVCTETFSLPSPLFNRDIVNFQPTVAAEENDEPLCVKGAMALSDTDEVCDFLGAFDDKIGAN